MELRFAALLVFLAVLSAPTKAADTHFRGITCKSDVVKVMQGRSFPDEPASATEAKHRDINLESLGDFSIETNNDPLKLSSWLVCGREYILLEKKGVVKDVLASPFPSAEPQSEISACLIDGKQSSDPLVWFSLDQSKEKTKSVSQAWMVDERKIKFVKLLSKTIQCESTR